MTMFTAKRQLLRRSQTHHRSMGSNAAIKNADDLAAEIAAIKDIDEEEEERGLKAITFLFDEATL